MEVNTVCGIMYDVKAKAIVEALVEREAKVENKKLGERLAKVEADATLTDRVVAVEVDTLRDKLCMVRTEALIDKLAYGKKRGGWPDPMLHTCRAGRRDCDICTADKLSVMEDEKVGNGWPR